MPLQLDLQFFADDAEEKTEKATSKKRSDEREKGKVAKSQEINTAVLLLFCFILLITFGGSMKSGMTHLYEKSFSEFAHWDVTISSVHDVFVQATLEMAKIIAPVMAVAIAAGLIANLGQIGFLFTAEPLKFDLNKINPFQGAKRIFSLRALVELFKSLLKIAFIGTITFSIIWMFKDDMMMLAFKTTDDATRFFGRTAMLMGIASAVALLLLAVFDYAYQRYDFEKNMKMSKKDIKDEHKNMEGDPQLQSKIKEKQRQMASRRMMSEVPEADVVITNPTHYAVAIKYEEETASAPFVIAKGADHLATKIKAVAGNNHIVLMENQPLARSLYEKLEIRDVIPEEFYQAVAEILAYVYRLENKV